MIEKIYGVFYIRCDVCEELSYESFATFQGAVDNRGKIDWHVSRQDSGEFEDICPECKDG